MPMLLPSLYSESVVNSDYKSKMLDLDATVRDFLINNVAWETDAELKRLLRGTPTVMGWADQLCEWGRFCSSSEDHSDS